MKFTLFLATALALISQTSFAACNEESLKENVAKYIGDGYFRTLISKAKTHGVLKPGQKMNVLVAVDDFDVVNRSGSDVLVVSLFGSDRLGDDAFWLAQVNASTCEVIQANEVLNTGGGDL